MSMQESESIAVFHVLLAGDDANRSAEVAIQLTRRGHHISIVHQPDEVLAAAEQPWDAVVIDFTFAESALELTSALHRQQPSITTILLTDPQPMAVIEAGQRVGVYDWLFHPVETPLLLAALQRAHERRMLLHAVQVSSPTLVPLTHAINNQLAGIIGLAQLLRTDTSLSGELSADMDVIIASARRIHELLEQLRPQY